MKNLRIYNSMTAKVEDFHPIVPGKASIYVCGPTVYSSPHVGNFRPVISFDVLRRVLIKLGYQVTFVSNYTDVDDKIINEAKKEGITEKELTERVIKEFASLVDAVGSMQPDYKPRPTVYMPQIIKYIDELVQKGAAYEADGDVYFRISQAHDYGTLSGNTVESLLNGARIEVNSKKESPIDFTLWKKTEEGIKWDTKWSCGRPGWHTECCVMIDSIFRDQNGLIDIHGGGFDLKFPHHENEIAQSEAHNGNKLANYWMHNGFVNINNEKMSKSLGNVMLTKDVVAAYGGEAMRLVILNAHYRAPVSFSEDTFKEAVANVNKLKTVMKQLAVLLETNGIDVEKLVPENEDAFLDALCDDLNTPNALSILYEEVKTANMAIRTRPLNLEAASKSFAKLKDYLNVLGLPIGHPHMNEEDLNLYLKYQEAKAAKDFARSDELRATLSKHGIL
ncbi:MAG: cysteine--tRNA ligase [Bacilli bacterium]|nr:cysteine--tRNA ligase [Bacilli bacterium]